MKVKKIAVITSIWLVIISLFMLYILYFYAIQSRIQQLLLSIFTGVFTSALVTLFIYISEYAMAKMECLEDYYLASLNVINKFLNLKYLDFDEPIDSVKEYCDERFYNNNSIFQSKCTTLNKSVELNKLQTPLHKTEEKGLQSEKASKELWNRDLINTFNK